MDVDKSIDQFPSPNGSSIQTVLKYRSKWSNEDYNAIKKRIIDGYNKKVTGENVEQLGEKYLNFYYKIFPDESGSEIKSKININKVESLALMKIHSMDSLSPDDIRELVLKSQELGVQEFDTQDKIKNKFEYHIVNWELFNGIFPNLDSDFILQKSEQCIFKKNPVEYLERKQVTKRVNYSGPRMRIRIAKGLSYNVGSYTVNHEKEIINQSKGIGVLNLTTKRILFKGAEKNITVTLKSIIDIEPFSDAVIIHRSSGNPIIFKVSDGLKLYQYLNAALKIH